MRDYPAIRRVLILTMALNFAATAAKLSVGTATGALSLVADGLDSLFDGLGNLAGLVGIAVASRPPDEDHPYGHRKFETFAALIIALLLFFTCWQLVESAVARLRQPPPVEVNAWSFAALLFSIAVQGATSIYELRRGRALRSEILVADALHTRAGILASLAVMAGLIGVRAGYPWADPLVTLAVALWIGKIGVDIVRENTPALLDRAAIDQQQVAAIVAAVPGVESFHRIRSRGHADAGALDLHVRVAPELSMQQANAIADEVRRRLLALDAIADVTVHVEAQRRSGPAGADTAAVVERAAAELGLRVHEQWLQRIGEEMLLELHVGVDPALSVGQAHDLVDRLERACLDRLPSLTACQSHIELYTPQILAGTQAATALHAQVTAAVAAAVQRSPGLTQPHNLSVRQSSGQIMVSFEVIADPDLPIAAAHALTSHIEADLRGQLPQLGEVLIHVEPYDHG